MRGLMGDPGFNMPVLAAVAVTTAFAYFLDAPSELAAAMLVLGLFTALVEHRLHSDVRRR